MLTINVFSTLSHLQQQNLLTRPVTPAKASLGRVAGIIENVKNNGDAAIAALTAEFDKVRLESTRISEHEISDALNSIPSRLKDALATAAENIRLYHQKQIPQIMSVETCDGVVCERITRAIEKVGLYVPAGSAPLPSTALMLAIPAQLARCDETIVCTPPGPNGKADPSVLAALYSCGITSVYKIGGAQAIAAMAYGTETIPKVNKIFGPGNSWVTAAKQQVATDPLGAACDMPAGPSEILVIADASADPNFVASDLLSQAEHGPDSQVLLVTPDENLAQQVNQSIEKQLRDLPRAHIARLALANSRAIIVTNLDQALTVSNAYAPEHLILNIKTPRDWLGQVKNAGSIFLGPWTPESVGDYCSGTNHVLPTYGYAKSYSGLSVSDFQKQMSVQELTPTGLKNIGWVAQTIAETEGLQAHANAVSIRLDTLDGIL